MLTINIDMDVMNINYLTPVKLHTLEAMYWPRWIQTLNPKTIFNCLLYCFKIKLECNICNVLFN